MTDLKPEVVITDLPSPAPNNPLEALSWLGDTVEEVVEGLRARGIKGKVGNGDRCPLANYLHEWWPEAWVAIGKWSRSNSMQAQGICPLPCARFESLFDDGCFPEFIAP